MRIEEKYPDFFEFTSKWYNWLSVKLWPEWLQIFLNQMKG